MLSDLFSWIFTDPSSGQVAAYRVIVLFLLGCFGLGFYAVKKDLSILKKKTEKIEEQTNGKK